MALVIVESPNKCGKIRKALGPDYVVTTTFGHIMDLDKKKMGIELDTWTPRYVINPDKKDVVKSIKQMAKEHKDIYVATDPDNEGHCISFNIRDILPKKGKNIYRVVFGSLEKNVLKKAFANPIPFDEKAYAAQKVRRMADRLVGFKVSPLLWTKGLKGTSAGRVQSAALKFIVDREIEIRNFKVEEYWTIQADMDGGFSSDFYGINSKKYVPKNEKQAKAILDALGKELVVSSYVSKQRKRKPLPPYMTSSMQKDAGTRFSWTSKKVMDVAQSLYAKGLCSYIRTDSTRVEPGKIKEIREMIKDKYGEKYLSKKVIQYGPKEAAQDAHEAIRPTFEKDSTSTTNDEDKLLRLITDRFMASQMAPAIFEQAKISLDYKGDKTYNFRTNGSVQKFDGFLRVYGSSTKDVVLPVMKKGDKVKIKAVEPKQHFTRPPSRYTEPAFTEKMEKEGIGRPATFAATIETLIRRGYAYREKKALHGTEIGEMVSAYLQEYMPEFTNPKFTAEIEKKMDEIASGDTEMNPVMDVFYKELKSEIKKASSVKKIELFVTDIDCADCKDGTKMVKRINKGKVYYRCQKYPKCGCIMTVNSDGEIVNSKVETGIPCPKCGGKVIKREGRYGPWASCEAHPTCKFKASIDKDGKLVEKAPAEKMDVKCKKCGSHMLKRDGKYGPWAGCSSFPKCKYRVKLDEKGKVINKKKNYEETGKKCPKCKKNDLVLRTNSYNNNKFIACLGFPKCRYTKKADS